MRRSWEAKLILGAMLALVLTNALLLLLLPGPPMLDRVEAYLTLLAVYGLAFGLVSSLPLPTRFRNLLSNMTSPDAGRFLVGNFAFMTLLFSSLVSAAQGQPRMGLATLLRALVTFCFVLLLLAWAVLHLLVIAPLAYPAFVVASAPLTLIVDSLDPVAPRLVQAPHGRRLHLPEGKERVPREVARLNVQSIVRRNEATLRSYLVGIPSVLLTAALALAKRFA